MPGTGVIDASRKFHRAGSADANKKKKRKKEERGGIGGRLLFGLWCRFECFLFSYLRVEEIRSRRDLFVFLFFVSVLPARLKI